MNNILYLAKNKGGDTQTNLRLEVRADKAPLYLSDFNGGRAFYRSGFSGQETELKITLHKGDENRISLTSVGDSFQDMDVVLSPRFAEETVNGKRRRLTCKLEIGQTLSFCHDFEFNGHSDLFEVVNIA